MLLPWLYLVLLLAVDLCGLTLAAFTLPGTWVILIATAVYAAVTRGHYLGWRTCGVLLALAVLAEIGEFVIGGAGAKKAGASKWGILGSLVGAILGGLFLGGFLPIFFPLSAIAGICLGSFGGAFLVELLLGGPLWKSARIGLGAAVGRFLGIIGKFTIALVMLLLSITMAWPTGYRPPARRAPAASTGPTTQLSPGPRRGTVGAS